MNGIRPRIISPPAKVVTMMIIGLVSQANNTAPNSRNGSTTDMNSANFFRDDMASPMASMTVMPHPRRNNERLCQSKLSDTGWRIYAGRQFYGTFDQGGNVWEWNDAMIGTSRGLRGSAWNYSEGLMAASFHQRLHHQPRRRIEQCRFPSRDHGQCHCTRNSRQSETIVFSISNADIRRFCHGRWPVCLSMVLQHTAGWRHQ